MDGNLQLMGPTICIEEQARAAKRSLQLWRKLYPVRSFKRIPRRHYCRRFLWIRWLCFHIVHTRWRRMVTTIMTWSICTPTRTHPKLPNPGRAIWMSMFMPQGSLRIPGTSRRLRKIMQLRADPLLGY
jgi:hypothetical protein